MEGFTEKLHSWATNRTVEIAVRSRDIPICGVISLVVFKLLGGRLRSVLPNSLIHPGAFARRYIPAKGKKYAADEVKQKQKPNLQRGGGTPIFLSLTGASLSKICSLILPTLAQFSFVFWLL